MRAPAAAGGSAGAAARPVRPIHELVDGFEGQVLLYAKNLDTSVAFGLREDERVRTAGTIKLAVMVEAFGHFGVGRTLRDAEIADKTGALDALRSDVAIVYSKNGRIAMAITIDDMPGVDWTVDNPGLLLMSKLSLALLDGLAGAPRP